MMIGASGFSIRTRVLETLDGGWSHAEKMDGTIDVVEIRFMYSTLQGIGKVLICVAL